MNKNNIIKRIEQRGNKWVIVSHENGKVLSTHDSKEKAEAALRAMMANKEKPASKDINKYVPLCKVNIEKQVVTGIVLEPETVDLQGDIYDAETIETSAHNFMKDVRTMGLMHKWFGKDVHVVESYIAPVDFKIDEHKIKQGTWLMAVKVIDKDVWNAVKNGELTGFSIGGAALVEEV